MCNPYAVPLTINPDTFFSIIAALATVTAAVAAWYSATQSSKSLKIGSNPILYAAVAAEGISPNSFNIYIRNVGSGLAREIKLLIPALGIDESFLNIEKEKESASWTVKVIVDARPKGDKDLLNNPQYHITYKNIFGDSITTIGKFYLEPDQGRPGDYRVTRNTEWDIRF